MEDDEAGAAGPRPRPGHDTEPIDLGRYRARRAFARRMALLAALERAVGRHDVTMVREIIDDPELARGLPRRVRDEAIAIAYLPPHVHRAPVNLYRHQHALAQLGDDAFLAIAGAPRPERHEPPESARPVRPAPALPLTPVTGPDRGRRGSGSR